MTTEPLNVRVPSELRREIEQRAKKTDKSLGSVVVDLLWFALHCPWAGFERPAAKINALTDDLFATAEHRDALLHEHDALLRDRDRWKENHRRRKRKYDHLERKYDKLKRSKTAQVEVPAPDPAALDLLRAWLEEIDEPITCPECENDLELTWKTTKPTKSYLVKRT